MSSSTLVETVSINYDDFSESFLTCSTCLCPYDQAEHKPKLLSCSHTVCAQCLERIAGLPQSQDSGTIRCPICRENIPVPRGGVPSLPPSFLVNQLIDLMQRQRRDVVPKGSFLYYCTAHPAEELLFCETCDTVFCPMCSDPSDVNNGCHNHTIVPFSIAIKRMSEILLYKANQCVKNLNRASENVEREMGDLDKNVDRILDEINQSFQDLSQLLDRRRQEIIETVRRTRDDKRKVLQEQLGIIQGEKAKVEQECNGLQYQVLTTPLGKPGTNNNNIHLASTATATHSQDEGSEVDPPQKAHRRAVGGIMDGHYVEVRNITRKIGDLNQKLDTTLTLIEPRENAFIRYDSSTGEVLKGIQAALAHFGSLCVSRTFPSLCTARSTDAMSVHVESVVSVTTIDYNGQYRSTGGDPVEGFLSSWHDQNSPPPPTGSAPGVLGGSPTLMRKGVKVTTDDREDGTYQLKFRVPVAGTYRMEVKIFGRPIKNSPLKLEISPHNNPVWQFGSRGSDWHQLKQPVRVASGPDGQIFILDTGNSRVTVLTPEGEFRRHVIGEGMVQHSAVGLAVIPDPRDSKSLVGILTLNWRTKAVTEWTLDGREVRSFTFTEFVEPIDLAVDSRGRILVADNGARKVFVFDSRARPVLRDDTHITFPVNGHVISTTERSSTISATGNERAVTNLHVTCVAVGMNDDILVGGSGVQMYDSAGKFVRTISLYNDFRPIGGGSGRGMPTNRNSAFVGSPSVAVANEGLVGGLSVDRFETGTVLAAVMDKNRTYLSVSRYKGDAAFGIDSFGAKLKRPSGICVTADRQHCLVADLGNHCIKKFRFK